MNQDAVKQFLPGLLLLALSIYLAADRRGLTRRHVESYTMWINHPQLFTWLVAAIGIGMMVIVALGMRQRHWMWVIPLCLGVALTLGAPVVARFLSHRMSAWAVHPHWIEWSWLAGAGVCGLLGVVLLVLAVLATWAVPG